jgi:hypothetical protein
MAIAGIALMAVSIVIIVHPTGFQRARGLYFALILGVVLVCAAVVPV